MRPGRLKLAREVWRQFGPGLTAYRAAHAVSRKTGWLKRRFPACGWDAHSLAHWCRADVPTEPEAYRDYRNSSEARFFFTPGKPPDLPAEATEDAVAKSREVLAGRPAYFFHQRGEPGFPFDWFVNPFTGQRTDAQRHWCDRSDFEADQGDIKVIWEPSRCAWAYDLVRAYAGTGDDQYAAGFWALVESWREANPPNMGPNWQCGQECALRSMALCFGLYGLWNAPATTPQRVVMLSQMLAEHAARIEANIAFACSQRNNHALSEAVGIYTVGTLFPEFGRSGRWRQRGKRILEGQLRRQIFSDGAYIQHSMNYHRVMLHDCLWVLRLAELNGDRFAEDVTELVERSIKFLHELQDEPSGRVPNYGANDGALVLPLNACDYLDYRPVIQAGHHQFQRDLPYASGPWDEDLLWLFGAEALDAPRKPAVRTSTARHAGGYYTLRGKESWALTRCHTYRTRPGQADMLHLDLWWRGLNILRDVGTFCYNCPPPWNRYFRSTAAHNTAVVGGADQMTKGPRFMWFDWTAARLLEHRPAPPEGTEVWRGEHYGYRQRYGVVHRRAITRVGDSRWTVVDRLDGTGVHEIGLHWHLVDSPWSWEAEGRELRLELPAGSVWIRLACRDGAEPGAAVARGLDAPDRALGWESLYYGERTPLPVLRLVRRMVLPFEVETIIGLGRRPEE